MATQKTEQEQERELKMKLSTKVETMAQAIGALAKDGENTHSKFNFISNEQAITAIRNFGLDNKLSVSPLDVVEYEERESTTGNGKQVIRSIVKMSFDLVDLETGYSEIRYFVGADQDTGGKSMAQAITACSKYFLFKLFKITSKDEQDPDAKTTDADGGSKTQARAGNQGDDDRQWLNPNDADGRWQKIVAWIAAGNEFKGVYQKYKLSKVNAEKLKKDAEEFKNKK